MKSNLLKSLKLTLAFCVFFSVFYIFILWVFAKVAGPMEEMQDVSNFEWKNRWCGECRSNFTEDIYFGDVLPVPVMGMMLLVLPVAIKGLRILSI